MNATRLVVALSSLLWAAVTFAASDLSSGLELGRRAPAFDPQHVAGPDKGTHTRPMCKHGSHQGVGICMNIEDLTEIARMATRLAQEMRDKGGTRPAWID